MDINFSVRRDVASDRTLAEDKFEVSEDEEFSLPTFAEFERDFMVVLQASTDPKTKTFAYNRNTFLKSKFNTHVMLNRDRELASQKAVPHRDFYNVRKVDTHIHHSACMNLSIY